MINGVSVASTEVPKCLCKFAKKKKNIEMESKVLWNYFYYFKLKTYFIIETISSGKYFENLHFEENNMFM